MVLDMQGLIYYQKRITRLLEICVLKLRPYRRKRYRTKVTKSYEDDDNFVR